MDNKIFAPVLSVLFVATACGDVKPLKEKAQPPSHFDIEPPQWAEELSVTVGRRLCTFVDASGKQTEIERGLATIGDDLTAMRVHGDCYAQSQDGVTCHWKAGTSAVQACERKYDEVYSLYQTSLSEAAVRLTRVSFVIR